MCATLTTPRLLLRPMQFGDWPAYRDLMATGRSLFMGGPFATRTAWGMFCSDHAQWDFFGCGALMMEDRGTGACLGQVGINHGPLYPESELGWFVYPQAEGHGLAFEAASALRDWARQECRLSTLVSYVDPANDRSRRLAERLGAVLGPDAARPDPTDLVYRHFGVAPGAD
jgi:RimJ/RimL family protein N-acetyltransferase